MRILFTTIVIMLHLGTTKAQTYHDLEMKVTGIKRVKGIIGVCLIQDAKEFMADCKNYTEYKVTGQEMVVSFGNIKSGTYAISIYHDANENGKLDTNFIGLPKERYGFSNNPSTRFGPPSYKKCLFKIERDTQLGIRMR